LCVENQSVSISNLSFSLIIVGGEGRENRGPRADRGDYRRKEGGANGDFKPEFRGGLGKSALAGSIQKDIFH
jgi:hypothetical protein